MVARRFTVALFVAFSISLSFTWWIGHKVARAATKTVVPLRKIVSVKQNVAVGVALTPQLLQSIEWPGDQPFAGTFNRPEEVNGRVTMVPLAAGDVVLAHDLAVSGAGSGLMARVPAGLRALTLRASDLSGDTSFLTPGSLVDVLATYRLSSGSDLMTSTVLQSVPVLAVGASTDPNAEAKAGPPPTVTVLLAPQDAEKLTLASSLGKILLSLRNGADRDAVPGLLAANSPTGEEAPTPKPSVVAVHVARNIQSSAKVPFTVETIAGNKHSEDSFGGVD